MNKDVKPSCCVVCVCFRRSYFFVFSVERKKRRHVQDKLLSNIQIFAQRVLAPQVVLT